MAELQPSAKHRLAWVAGSAWLLALAVLGGCHRSDASSANPPGMETRDITGRWDDVKLFRAYTPPPPDWNTMEFDDSDWELAFLWAGYGGKVEDLTTGLAEMPGRYTTVYLRRRIELGPTSIGYSKLLFDVGQGAGYAIYVNGVELGRYGVPAGADYSTPADGTGPETVEFDMPPGLLQELHNVIAIELHLPHPAPPALLIKAEMQGVIDWPTVPLFFKRGPYLQRAVDDEMTVAFETSRPTAARVVYARKGEPLAVVESPKDTFHAIRLTGLAPSAAYQWRAELVPDPDNPAPAVAGQTVQSEWGTFTTAPLPHEPFSFLLIGDTRNDGLVHARLVEQMATESADFVLHVGDFVWLGGNEVAWDGYFGVAAPLLKRLPLFPTLGNHELWYDDSATHYEKFFVVPDTGPDDQGKRAYSYRYGNSYFIVLNSSQDDLTPNWGSQPDWLQSELYNARSDPSIRHVFLTMHRPVISSGDVAPAPEQILRVLRAYPPTLLLQGHDHLYERGELDGIRWVVTGGGGGPLGQIKERGIPSSLLMIAEYHYGLIDVDGRTVTLRAKLWDGTVMDELRIEE